jgi:hypothetical protein
MKRRTLTWGFGLEHETHLFHVPVDDKNVIQNVLLSDTMPVVKRILENNSDEMTDVEIDILKRVLVAYEYSGRKCGNDWVLPRIKDIKMPEFITTDPFSTPQNKKILFDYFYDLYHQEIMFVRILKKYDATFKSHIAKYGDVRNYITGMTSHIKVARDYNLKNLTFDKKTYVDYTGSYHLTVTLPFNDATTDSSFIKMHTNFANQFQWLEPLLLTAFFSCDDREPGSTKKLVRGSYRVMRIGWGNLAGSDIRKFGQGIGRYTNHKGKWRKHPGLTDFFEIEKVNECDKYKKKDEPGSISLMSSNIRTFGSTDPLRPWIRESGAGMNKPNGIELRIFDNFDIKDLYELCKLVIFIAENSREHQTKEYVYDNKGWIDSLAAIMQEGWRANITKPYLIDLRRHLKLKIKTSTLKAFDVFTAIADELYEKNKNGKWTKLMLGRFVGAKIILPQWNRMSWDVGFMMKCNNNKLVYALYNALLHQLSILNVDSISLREFSIIYNKTMGAKKGWDKNMNDVIFFMLAINPPIFKSTITNDIIMINNVNLQFHLSKKNFNHNLYNNFLYASEMISKEILTHRTIYILKRLSSATKKIFTKDELLDIIKAGLMKYNKLSVNNPNFHKNILLLAPNDPKAMSDLEKATTLIFNTCRLKSPELDSNKTIIYCIIEQTKNKKYTINKEAIQQTIAKLYSVFNRYA